MPSTWTQTPWSWLQDLSATAHLHAQEKTEPVCTADSSGDVRETEGSKEATTTPPSQDHPSARHSRTHSVADVKLPQLVKDDCCSDRPENSSSKPIEEELKFPPVLMQLQDCDFSSSSDSEGSDDEHKKDESEIEDKFLDLKSTNLPWPTILQYLRESESIASEYFSLKNKQTLAETHRQIESCDRNDFAATEGGKGTLLPDQCDFCGVSSQRHNLLNSQSPTAAEAETPFCCEEYKEFCLLVAGCMRQMVEKQKHDKPKKISIQPNKKLYKKTAEERAMAMLCRKKKWEELRKKRKQMEKLQSSSFYSLTKQTKTIQFSLVSPTAQWLVGQDPSSSSQPQAGRTRVVFRKHKGRKQKEEEANKFGELPRILLDRLKQEVPPLGELDVRYYSNGRKFATILPNKTGQCYYPSGNMALMIYTPYEGVLAYLLFEDLDHPQLLAYLDELGRACCYNPDGGIRLLRTPLMGILFDQHGSLRKRWLWKDCSKLSSSLFQPVTVTFSKQLSVRCTGQEMTFIQFSAQQQHLKFSVTCKLSDAVAAEALGESPMVEKVKAMENYLHKTKARINQLMLVLQQSHRVQKLAELQSVYAPRSKHGGHSEAHKKTRSTGALNLHHKTPSKHTTTLRPLLH